MLSNISAVSQGQLTLGNLQGSALSLAIIETASVFDGLSVLLCADSSAALKLESELGFLAIDHDLDVLVFPDWETLPYDNFSPHQDIISQRLETLYRLPNMSRGILILPVATAMAKLPPPSFLAANSLLLRQDQIKQPSELKQQLDSAGYANVHQVMAHGEYSQRGSILDIFPMGSTKPYRIDYLDDSVDSIRFFDFETQRSTDKVTEIKILPAHEFPTNQLAIEQFRSSWRELFGASNQPESIYQQVSKRVWPAGIEYYLPLFFSQTHSFTDFLPSNNQLLTFGDIMQGSEMFWADVSSRYEDRRYDLSRPILDPTRLYQRVEEFFASLKGLSRTHFEPQKIRKKAGQENLNTAMIDDIAIDHKLDIPSLNLDKYLAKRKDFKIIFCVESLGRQEALLGLLKHLNHPPAIESSYQAALTNDHQFSIIVAPLENSVELKDLSVSLICETELFGIKISQRRRREKARAQSSEAIVRSLAELSIGQPVVHYDHGVGRYLGLTYIENAGLNVEYVTLAYANDAKLYVPVASLHLISRYSGASEDSAPLHNLGSEKWQNAKRKAAEKVRDVAAELLEIYAQRAAKPGHAFKVDFEHYQQFAASFPFEETVDQQNAILHVINDMQKDTAMDRLVCGDVGFGKTEVAMRAAFVAVTAGKQVAILVPTTLLAQQHFDNFTDRFAQQPLRVGQLSRFRSAKQQAETLADLEKGTIDIVIG
ncbi:MAG: DEAD/DEAH box helicase, partial [Gammaproteobacteria bacterium]|nr:DEAD/DEAH box helicase [Gammaproteobacteria bacterium]